MRGGHYMGIGMRASRLGWGVCFERKKDQNIRIGIGVIAATFFVFVSWETGAGAAPGKGSGGSYHEA